MAASPYENVHSKLLIDATTLAAADPRSSNEPLEGSFKQEVPTWRQGLEPAPSFDGLDSVLALDDVSDARMLRDSMLVVTTNVPLHHRQGKVRMLQTMLQKRLVEKNRAIEKSNLAIGFFFILAMVVHHQ